MTQCPSCGIGLKRKRGRGRPAVYCSEPCRRLAEFTLRILARRIDRQEVELRELQASAQRIMTLDEEIRRARVALVRKWLAEDQAKLAALLGAPRR